MISYELAKKLKDAGYPQKGKGYIERWDVSPAEPLYIPTLSELIEAVKGLVKELAIGWNDSGCFWHFQYGPRGAGSMMDGIGETFSASDEDDLDAALANLWLKLNNK